MRSFYIYMNDIVFIKTIGLAKYKYLKVFLRNRFFLQQQQQQNSKFIYLRLLKMEEKFLLFYFCFSSN
jgi:hypothetical protein